MNASPLRRYRWRVSGVLSLCVAAALLCVLVSKPVLLHTHALSTQDTEACGDYNKEATGITVLSPFRSRVQERLAETFLRRASSGECSPDTTEELCAFVRGGHSVPTSDWRLVNRQDKPGSVTLLYRLTGSSQEFMTHNGCMVARVSLQRTDNLWKVVGYGVTPGPFRAR